MNYFESEALAKGVTIKEIQQKIKSCYDLMNQSLSTKRLFKDQQRPVIKKNQTSGSQQKTAKQLLSAKYTK